MFRNRLAPLWHRRIASDPGLARLSLAARATATAALALGLLYALGKIANEPLPATLFGVVIALISSIAVNDPDPKQQRITTLLLPLPAAFSITLGAWLAPFRIAGDAVFVVLIFGAVYVRRFGPRGFALGMLTFITYFFSLFLNTGFSQLPWLMLALVLGAACAYIMRFVLFPERPKRRLQRILQAFYARIGRILDEAGEVIAAKTVEESRRRTLRLRKAPAGSPGEVNKNRVLAISPLVTLRPKRKRHAGRKDSRQPKISGEEPEVHPGLQAHDGSKASADVAEHLINRQGAAAPIRAGDVAEQC
jgi:putative flippase GtrA